MCEEENNMERIANAIISYLKLKLKIKTIKEDEEIKLVQNENGVPTNRLYILREFNTECYIIEKVYFNEFCSSINFNDLTLTLDISNEISKDLFIKDFINYFKKKPYVPIHKNIKIYSNLEEMKQISQNFNDYELVNKEILCYGMGVSPSLLEGKMMKVSKNKENTCLMSVSNNFTFIINNSSNEDIKKNDKNENEINKNDINQKSEKKENKINDNDINENKENNDNNENENNKNDKYKNLYYVDDLTKKIFILLYLNEQKIKKKLKKEINNVYKFKKYYLISKDWLKEYKEFFLYDFVIKKFKEQYKKEYNYEGINKQNNEDNDNNEIYSYDIANINLNDIVKNIGQISLFSKTIISDKLRDAKKLIPEPKKILTRRKEENNGEYEQETEDPEFIENYIKLYTEFDFINKDIFELLEKEEFFIGLNDEIKNQIEFQVLIGSYNIIIKNKSLDEENQRFNYLNEYLFYIDKNDKSKYLEDENIDKNDQFILYYILNYSSNKSFFNDLKNLTKKKWFI